MEKLSYQFYNASHKLYDENNERNCLEQRSQTNNQAVHDMQNVTIMISKSQTTKPSVNDEVKRFVTRKCDSSCKFPSDWGRKLYRFLWTIKPCLNFKQMQLRIIELDQCSFCEKFDEQCGFGESCTNVIKFLFILSKHFQGLRTLLR